MAQSRNWANSRPHRPVSKSAVHAAGYNEQRRAFQDAANTLIASRRTRHQFVSSSWLGEPAWDILLALYANDGRCRMTAGDVIDFCAIPSTTALRWFAILEESGLLIRNESPTDRRVVYLELSDAGRIKLDGFFAQIELTLFAPLSRQ